LNPACCKQALTLEPHNSFYSNKRELPSGSPFFPVGEEEIIMAMGAEIDPKNLFFLNPLPFHLSNIDLSKINHPLSRFS
jgi:hypothetical protein